VVGGVRVVGVAISGGAFLDVFLWGRVLLLLPGVLRRGLLRRELSVRVQKSSKVSRTLMKCSLTTYSTCFEFVGVIWIQVRRRNRVCDRKGVGI
jgi:hypothetical protein